MPRSPKPWFWTARNAWYVQLGGKHVRLAEDKRQADREFYRIMAADGKLDANQRGNIRVIDACEAMIAQAQVHRASTRRHYTEKLSLFAGAFGHRQLASIDPTEVKAWVSLSKGAGRRPFGEASRSLQFGFVKRLFKWARATGLTQSDPFVMVANPWRIAARDRVMNMEEYEAVMTKQRLNDHFKFVVELVWRAGMRPGEVAALSARHLDSRLPVVRLQPTEHKTGTKTGVQREIYFPPDLWEKLKSLANLRPSGTIIRNQHGDPWTGKSISKAFNQVKESLGLECVLYQARHRFLTSLVDSGVPEARVAKLAGHSDTKSLMKHYYHPDVTKMVADVTAAGEADMDHMATIAAKVQEAKANARAKRLAAKRADSERYRAALKAKKEASGT